MMHERLRLSLDSGPRSQSCVGEKEVTRFLVKTAAAAGVSSAANSTSDNSVTCCVFPMNLTVSQTERFNRCRTGYWKQKEAMYREMELRSIWLFQAMLRMTCTVAISRKNLHRFKQS